MGLNIRLFRKLSPLIRNKYVIFIKDSHILVLLLRMILFADLGENIVYSCRKPGQSDFDFTHHSVSSKREDRFIIVEKL
jgi:hypothetical protein